MPRADFTFDVRREHEEPLNRDFAASRPAAGARTSSAPPAEDRPLHLDLDLTTTREPPRRRPGATYHGFAQETGAARPGAASPAAARARRTVRTPRSRRGLLVVGLAAVMAVSVAGALWTYSALEPRMMGQGGMSAAPTPPAPATAPAPVATAPSPAPAPAPSGAAPASPDPVKPAAEAETGQPSAQIDAAALPPPAAQRPERLADLTEPAPEPARPMRREPSEVRRPAVRMERPGDSAATARANLAEAYAPASTLSAQAAGQRPY